MISYSEFQECIRDSVLIALDKEFQEIMGNPAAQGATDNELVALFRGIEPHIKTLAERINAGHEFNSAFVQVDMEN